LKDIFYIQSRFRGELFSYQHIRRYLTTGFSVGPDCPPPASGPNGNDFKARELKGLSELAASQKTNSFERKY
jgi:hypothetical protein